MVDRENIGVIVMILAFLGLLFGGAAVVWNQHAGSTDQDAQDAAAQQQGVVIGQGFGGNINWGSGSASINERLQTYNDAVDANPESVGPYLDRAEFYNSIGNTREALNDYDNAVQLDPSNVAALKQRAQLYREYGEYQNAIDDCTAILEVQPENESVCALRAEIRSETGDHVGAAEDYGKAMEMVQAPQSANYRDRRAWEYFQLGAFEAAIADYTKLIEVGADRARALLSRGYCLYKLRRYDEALEDLQASVEQKRSAWAYTNLAQVQHAMGDWSAALSSADMAAAFQQEDQLRALRMRAMIHSDLGNYDLALRDLNAALERIDLGSDDSVISDRAWLHWVTGDLAAAASEYTRAIRFAPRELDNHMGLGIVSMYLGRLDVARVELLAAAEDADQPTDYAWLVRWIAAVRSDQRAHADALLGDHFERRTEQPDGDWPATLIGFVLGDLDEAALFEAVNQEPNQWRLAEKLCEAHFYAGVLQLESGSRDQAIEHFRQAIDTRQTSRYEYEAARSELRALGVLE